MFVLSSALPLTIVTSFSFLFSPFVRPWPIIAIALPPTSEVPFSPSPHQNPSARPRGEVMSSAPPPPFRVVSTPKMPMQDP